MNRRALILSALSASVSACATLPRDLPPITSSTVTLEFSNRYQFTGVGEAIQAVTASWANHVDFVLPDGRLLGAVPEGVCVRSSAKAPWVRTERYEFPADAGLVLGYALRQVGKPYDWLANLGYASRTGLTLGRVGWNCSRLVAAAALKGGVRLCPGRSPAMTAPGDLLRSPLLRRIA